MEEEKHIGKMVACRLRDDYVHIGMIVNVEATKNGLWYQIEWYGDLNVKHAYYPVATAIFYIKEYSDYKRRLCTL